MHWHGDVQEGENFENSPLVRLVRRERHRRPLAESGVGVFYCILLCVDARGFLTKSLASPHAIISLSGHTAVDNRRLSQNHAHRPLPLIRRGKGRRVHCVRIEHRPLAAGRVAMAIVAEDGEQAVDGRRLGAAEPRHRALADVSTVIVRIDGAVVVIVGL